MARSNTRWPSGYSVSLPSRQRWPARRKPMSRAICAANRKPWGTERHQREMMEGKPVRDSVSEYSEIALPNDANGLGNVLGGKGMHLVDLAVALAALRHARCPVVTATVVSLLFFHPVRIGQLIVLLSSEKRALST